METMVHSPEILKRMNDELCDKADRVRGCAVLPDGHRWIDPEEMLEEGDRLCLSSEELSFWQPVPEDALGHCIASIYTDDMVGCRPIRATKQTTTLGEVEQLRRCCIGLLRSTHCGDQQFVALLRGERAEPIRMAVLHIEQALKRMDGDDVEPMTCCQEVEQLRRAKATADEATVNLSTANQEIRRERDELLERLSKAERHLFARARNIGYRFHKGYDDDELLTMFQPYLIDGEMKGLSPREVRLLETIRDQNSEIATLKEQVAALDWHGYSPRDDANAPPAADDTVSSADDDEAEVERTRLTLNLMEAEKRLEAVTKERDEAVSEREKLKDQKARLLRGIAPLLKSAGHLREIRDAIWQNTLDASEGAETFFEAVARHFAQNTFHGSVMALCSDEGVPIRELGRRSLHGFADGNKAFLKGVEFSEWKGEEPIVVTHYKVDWGDGTQGCYPIASPIHLVPGCGVVLAGHDIES